MPKVVLIGFTYLLAIGTGLSFLAHWLVICRTLYRDRAKFPTGCLPWRIFHEMRWYRDLARARGDTMSLFYILLLGWWFNFGLGLTVGIWWLSEHCNPML